MNIRILTGLRTRLLVSYVLILVVSLAVIAGALLLFLRGQSPLTEGISLRLYTQLQQLEATQEQTGVIPPTGPTLLQRTALNRLDQRIKSRIILTNADGRVSYDSRHVYGYGSQLNIDPDAKPYIPAGTASSSALPSISGMMHDPDGSDWLFVQQEVNPADPQAQLFMIAIRAPALLTPLEILRYYAPDFVGPLLEAALLGLIVAVIAALLVARSVARPLQDVAKAAATIASGDLNQRVPERGPREVKMLAQSFNAMAQRIGETQQAQRDFLANVTHDLKTPLTSIQGFSQAIIDGVASNPTAAQRAAQIIYDEAGRLNRMVQELLDLARIEAGRFKMTQHMIPLGDVLNGVGEMLAPRAQEKGQTLTLDVPPLPTIAGDGDRLVQVYTNLIDNAMKHTPSGGQIALRASLDDGGILVQVSDTGEGIPAQDLPHVFDRFYQVDKSRQRGKREGAGLGLTIVKGIVDAHGGRLWVESQEGVGTTFSTWFPVFSNDSSTISIRGRNARFKAPAPRPVADH